MANPTVGNVMDFTYNFDQDPGAGVVNNGNVVEIANNRDTGRTQSFTYDELNRIATAQSQATSGANCWGQSYGYDIYANLKTTTVTKCSAYSLSLTFNPKNQISNTGFGYDAAGNFRQGISVLLSYDAENHMTTAGTVTYTYDGDGNRVKSSTGKLYWRGTGADPLTETDLAGTVQSEYVFFNGKRVARRDGSGNTVFYYFSNHLGSASVLTNSTGTIIEESDYYPFGRERIIVNSDPNLYKFTGKERDVETGLYNFGARFYHENGWFMSPDPNQLSGFLYPDDPQAWNGYAYVRNNPLTLADPSGEAFEYCQTDKEGKSINCSNVTDEQHKKDVQEGVNTFKDGKIYDGDKVIGTYRDLGPDIPGDPEANRQAAAMIVETFDSAMVAFGENAALAATGTIALRGLGVAAEGFSELNIFKNTKVVINWAHRITSIRPGHIPPPGSVAEITSAVEGAIQTGNYTVKAGGLIEGTTTIQGVKVGFSSRFVNGVARISTVFTDVR